MKNIEGVGYAPVRTPPFQGLQQSYKDLATLLAGDCISFVAETDRNSWDRRSALKSLQAKVPTRTAYGTKSPQIFVYEGNATNVMGDDT